MVGLNDWTATKVDRLTYIQKQIDGQMELNRWTEGWMASPMDS